MEKRDEVEIVEYIENNPVAVLGTVGKDHTLYGAAVYICALAADKYYFLTKEETQKIKNIRENHQVSVTIVNPAEDSILQAHGRANIIEDSAVIDLITSKIATIYAHGAEPVPPIAKIQAGDYRIVGIEAKEVRLTKYKGLLAQEGEPPRDRSE